MDRVDTMLLFNEGMLHKDTATIFRIFHQLGWPRPLVWVAWIPSPVRDASYRFAVRDIGTGFWGRQHYCFRPISPKTKTRFIDHG